jgi:transposase
MRKSFDGLTGIVQNELKADPLSGAIFIFLNRRRNQVKLLLWEGDGFSLYHKRLEKGSYELPAGSDEQLAVTIEADRLLLLLKGISLRHIRRQGIDVRIAYNVDRREVIIENPRHKIYIKESEKQRMSRRLRTEIIDKIDSLIEISKDKDSVALK